MPIEVVFQLVTVLKTRLTAVQADETLRLVRHVLLRTENLEGAF